MHNTIERLNYAHGPTFIQCVPEYQLGETVIGSVGDVSLTVGKGEFLDGSGFGKSTQLRLMAGLDRRASGAIRVQERHLAEWEADELARSAAT